MTTIADLGEFGLIARLTAGLPMNSSVILGAGDDAALLDVGAAGHVLVVTTDAQVEGVHFRRDTATPEEIGRRVLAVNISDIAAMGGEPRFALISLLAPPDLDVAFLDGVYAGMRAEAERYGVAIVGGNVARNPERLVLDVTLLGLADAGHVMRRDGARLGEALLVTGTLGAAAAGLRLLGDPDLGRHLPPEFVAELLAAQRTPTPQVAAGHWLARHGVRAALDISDGLAADLGHLCAASHVGATVDAASLPISPATARCAELAGVAPLEWALSGGEAYQLLFTIHADKVTECQAGLLAATGARATRIGTIDGEMGVRLVHDGAARALPALGWDHLRDA